MGDRLICYQPSLSIQEATLGVLTGPTARPRRVSMESSRGGERHRDHTRPTEGFLCAAGLRFLLMFFEW